MNIFGVHIPSNVLMIIAFINVSTGFIVVPSYIAWKISKRKKNHPFPDRNTVDAVFRESKASGRSHKSWSTRMSGAKKSLEVVVTDDEVWVYMADLLGWMVQQTDLDHRIPLVNISNVEQAKRSLLIVYKDDDEKSKTIELVLRKPDKFLQAIGKSM